MSTSTPARILVALDGSPHANHVFEAADAIARAMGSSVVALHVVGLSEELPRDALAVKPDRVLEEVAEAAETRMRAMVGTRPVRIRIETGTPVEEILRVAAEESADLIVVGAHGYRLAERVLGATASRIVGRADRSVLVVR